MDPFETRLKSLSLRPPSADFGDPKTLAELLGRNTHHLSLIERFQNMSFKSKAATIFSLAASVAVAFIILASATGSSVAFAQVAEKLRTARTLSFDWSVERESDAKVLGHGRNLFMVPGKVRIEFAGDAGSQTYAVLDTPGQKILFADAKQKTARVVPLKASGGVDKAAKAIDDIRSFKEQGARSLGGKQIDGVAAKGFEVDRANGPITVWANAATGDPIRIEILDKKNPDGLTRQIWTNIKLDPQLDLQLFSVAPPADYKLTAGLPSKVEGTPANFVADFLKLYAKHMNGQFPPSLTDAGKTMIEKLKPVDSNSPPSLELIQLPFYISVLSSVTGHGGQGERWQYYPGRKLGEADKIVFWLRDKKTGNYLAVYGDLRVEPIDEANLPPLEKK